MCNYIEFGSFIPELWAPHIVAIAQPNKPTIWPNMVPIPMAKGIRLDILATHIGLKLGLAVMFLASHVGIRLDILATHIGLKLGLAVMFLASHVGCTANWLL